MEPTVISFDIQKVKTIYKKYFDFEEKRFLKNLPWLPITLIAGGFIFLGLLFHLAFFLWIGVIMITITFLVIAYYKYKFRFDCVKFLNKLEQQGATYGMHYYSFDFDAEAIYYNSEDVNSKLTWRVFKYFIVNHQDIYLYESNSQLYDIISESIIGADRYNSFLLIISEKVKRVF